MKRSWFSFLIVGVVLGLLTLFLGLQNRWLYQVSQAERERMQKRVETDTNRLAEDFNREMQSVYYNFQTTAEMWKSGDWAEFNDRYDFWKERTGYPELVRGIYYFDKLPGSKPLTYDPARRAFETADTTPELETLRAYPVSEKGSSPFVEGSYAMVLPVHEPQERIEHIVLKRRATPDREIGPIVRLPEKFGTLIILLDRSVITDRMLPDLAAKYFPENDYRVAVFGRSDEKIFATRDVDAADATAPLFAMSPDNLLFFASRESLPRMLGEHRRGMVVNQRMESHTFSTQTSSGEPKVEDKIKEERAGSFMVELKEAGEGRPRTSIVSATTDGSNPWNLRVQHAAGSIDNFVRNERYKSFAIGLGVYLLLVVGILAIVLSALRARVFAQRQIDFVSSVSHEFRTPLAVIYSAGENLADGVAKADSQVSKYGELIKGEGRKLSGMVEQILEFAGANSGNRKYNFAVTTAADVINDALAECQPLIESGGFTVETDMPEQGLAINADRGALASAVQNLIANSIKYSDGSKWIKVSATNGGSNVKISVEDKGIGIAPEDVRRVFEPFYRAKHVVDEQISGNGLGLNLVKKIAEAHGGRVSAESSPGKGSKFTISLPVN